MARITTESRRPLPLRGYELLLTDSSATLPSGFVGYLLKSKEISPQQTRLKTDGLIFELPEELEYLSDGDIVRIIPQSGEAVVLYRKASPYNCIFLTEQCNCRCLFCPQPPRETQDDHWVQIWQEVIPMMSPETQELGIMGGEPTMLPDGLIKLIRTCKNYLPETALHLLSNGRMFNYLSFCKKISQLNHPNLVIGVPLYSDIAHEHDFLVQSSGAFDQTIRGLVNLARLGLRIELRVVLCHQTIGRLVSLARFINRNLPFAEHVAFMGLELTGYAKTRVEKLWVNPIDYQELLAMAVDNLVCQRIDVSIYNHPLCVLNKELWSFARASISDWKREYFDVCSICDQKWRCGGVFTSTKEKFVTQIAPC